jgi:hypothetical protein
MYFPIKSGFGICNYTLWIGCAIGQVQGESILNKDSNKPQTIRLPDPELD